MAGFLLVMAALVATGADAPAQQTEYKLDDSGAWKKTRAPQPGTDEATIGEARRLLAQNEPEEAESLLEGWIDRNESSRSEWLPEAYLLLGDAKLAQSYEYEAIFEYEIVARRFPGSEQFKTAVARELDIAIEYAHGLKRRFLGIRFVDAGDDAVELLIRVQERMPGSALAEKAGIELADYYFRNRDMGLAAEAYDLYIANYPGGPHRMEAMVRRILANIALFKGPEYDASSLTDAMEQVKAFMREYPAEAERRNMNQSLIERMEESQAAQVLTTAEWYLVKDDLPSARYQLERLLRRHPRTAAASRALQMLVERGWLKAPEPENPHDPTPPADGATGAGGAPAGGKGSTP